MAVLSFSSELTPKISVPSIGFELAQRAVQSFDAADAAEYLEDQLGEENAPSVSKLTDFREPSGPRCRAHTVRKFSPSHEAETPALDAADDLVDEMVHPKVAEIQTNLEDRKSALDSATDLATQGTLRTEIHRLESRRQEVTGRLESIVERIESGDLIGARDLGFLIDRSDVRDDADVIKSRVTDETFRRETSGPVSGDGFGRVSKWSARDAKRLYELLPVRLLRRTARREFDRPQERGIGQHVGEIGLERLMEESKFFGDSTSGTESTPDRSPSVPQSNPRRRTRPQFDLTTA